MDTDTQIQVNSIIKHGFYSEGAALGEGGWPALYKHGISKWKRYRLVNADTGEVVYSLIARDDQVAKEAFGTLFHLDEFAWEIMRVITIYTIIAVSDE